MSTQRMARSIAATMIMLAFVALGISVWLTAREKAVEKFPDIIATQPNLK